MSLTAELGPQVPYLRRYARALLGSQMRGDAAVHETLEALLAAPGTLDQSRPPRLELYRVFHRLWNEAAETVGNGGPVASLPLPAREALLLTALEGFSVTETAAILGSTVREVTKNIAHARQSIADSLHARVMIIEDEAIIAMHIKSIVQDLGHEVAGIARTRTEAATMAAQTRPELVLADISLGDGSSGIEAAKDIMGMMKMPVIFITAFPERLLTGERPEPTFLITKPFHPETVRATIGQALLVHRERQQAETVPC